MGPGRLTNVYSLTQTCTKPSNKLVSALLKHFWCQDEPRATRTHKTHHDLNLGETITFPLIVYFVAAHRAHIQMFFLSRDSQTPKWESQNCQSQVTLGPHNFACRLLKMKHQAKLQPSSRAFQQCVAHHLHTTKSCRFPTFNGRESNYQFDSRPFFWP